MTTLLILSRVFHYGSGMILLGVVAFRWLVLLPAFAGAPEESWQRLAPLFPRWNQMFVGAMAILLLSGLLMFWTVTANMSGTSLGESLNADTLGTVFFQTQFGGIAQWRLGFLVALALLLWPLLRNRWMARQQKSPLELVAGVVATALMVSFAWTGHAAASGGAFFFPRVAADALHLFVAAIWPTGLLPLAMFLACVAATNESSLIGPTRRVVGRFSAISLTVVFVLVATGSVNSWFLIGSFHALVASTYGHVLIVKLLLFVVILAVAAYNRFRLVPLVFAAGPQPPSTSSFAPLARLRTLSLVEFGLAVGIVAVVSVLGTTPPPS